MLFTVNLYDIMAEFKDVQYGIKESNTTNSVYLRIYYKGLKTTIRFSDHYKYFGGKAYAIKNPLGRKDVINIVNKRIKWLKRRYVVKKLGELNNEKVS